MSGMEYTTEAVKMLTDQSLLADIAQNDNDYAVRVEATERITNPSVWEEIAKTDKSSTVRLAAIKKLTDQAVLESIAQTDHSSTVRKAAVEKLTGQTALVAIAKTDKQPTVRCSALKKIYKTKFLNKKEIHELITDILKRSGKSNELLISTLWELEDFLSKKDLRTFEIEAWCGKPVKIDIRDIYYPWKLYYKGKLVGESKF